MKKLFITGMLAVSFVAGSLKAENVTLNDANDNKVCVETVTNSTETFSNKTDDKNNSQITKEETASVKTTSSKKKTALKIIAALLAVGAASTAVMIYCIQNYRSPFLKRH